MPHAVLIGDFIRSRGFANRDEVQRRFAVACASLNTERERLGLVSPLTITLGDEFQAVFVTVGRLWECIFRLEAAMAPAGIRFAVGLGDISTDINTATALGMDGPAFHAARAAMEQLKKGEARYRLAGLAATAACRVAEPYGAGSPRLSEWPETEDFLNAALALIAYNRVKWRTPRVLTMASLLQGKSVKDICLVTHSSEQAVYRNIRDGALDTVATMLGGIAGRMERALAGTAVLAGNAAPGID